jgi:hypothetical protein
MTGRVERETDNQSVQLLPDEPAGPRAAQPAAPRAFWNWPDGFATDIARATRSWIQYGMFGFAVICIVIGAIQGLLGR